MKINPTFAAVIGPYSRLEEAVGAIKEKREQLSPEKLVGIRKQNGGYSIVTAEDYLAAGRRKELVINHERAIGMREYFN